MPKPTVEAVTKILETLSGMTGWIAPGYKAERWVDGRWTRNRDYNADGGRHIAYVAVAHGAHDLWFRVLFDTD